MTRPGRDENGDMIEFGGRRGRRGPGRIVWLTVAVVAIAAVILATHHSTPRHDTAPDITPTAIGGPASAEPSATTSAASLKALGSTGRWQIIAREPARILRISPSTNQVVETTVPSVESTGPINLLTGPGWTLVRPLDGVPGYTVPDGKPVASIANAGGYIFPGPKPSQFWTQTPMSNGDTMSFELTDNESHGYGQLISVNQSVPVISDGTGNIIEQRSDGFYLDTAASSTLITKGKLLAAGPTRWLVSECVDLQSCKAALIDRKTGARHALPGFNLSPDDHIGSISPDGKSAAVFAMASDGTEQLHMVELDLGIEVPVQAPLPSQLPLSPLVWSPESKWLFFADRDGAVEAVDPATAHAFPLALGTQQPILQLVIRPA